jgi:predicted TIM-barrel fold metal-dependent hydrolase
VRAGPLFDLDIHEEFRDADLDLYPYLSKGWQEFVLGPALDSSLHPTGLPAALDPGGRNTVVSGGWMASNNPFGYTRKDAFPPEGGPPGSSPQLMIEQLLDPYDVQGAVLTGGYVSMHAAGLGNPYFQREVARACNDHMIDHWLAVDRRFLGSVKLALQVPEWAAAEIRRVADHPQIVQTIASTNPFPYPFGHPAYDAVHRACAETGLPFAYHTLGDGQAAANSHHNGGGQPTLYLEFHAGALQGTMTQLMSFIFHGVFDRYPTLKLILVEGGATWIPAVIKRLDAEFKGLRREVPWCKRLPSDYLRDNVLVTTQPFDVESADDPIIETLDEAGAADWLAFSSDYPHWDTDVPTRTVSVLPEHWRDRVLRENAASAYGIDLAVAA